MPHNSGQRDAPDGSVVLVVDDDATVRRVLREILQLYGYRVLEAGNGREAASLLQDHPVDLVLTDLVMPEKEGIETIKMVRARYPHVKIIAMSGAFGGEYLAVAGYLGADETLQKPLRMEVVIEAIRRMLADRTSG